MSKRSLLLRLAMFGGANEAAEITVACPSRFEPALLAVNKAPVVSWPLRVNSAEDCDEVTAEVVIPSIGGTRSGVTVEAVEVAVVTGASDGFFPTGIGGSAINSGFGGGTSEFLKMV